MDSHCRRCRKPLEVEEPQMLALLPALHPSHPHAPAPPSIDVAKAVRDLRHERGLSQRELALRMEVPRTYISKIENGKAQPTLASLERLAKALAANICELLHDARSLRQDAVSAALADPFLAELLPHVARMNGYQRSVILSHARDMATGRRRPAQA
jgi:transcriptional regulator with XRE-family HTH domain